MQRMKLTTLIFTILLIQNILCASDIFIRSENPGPYNVIAQHFRKAPVVDGKLDDECWKQVKPTGSYWLLGENKLAEKQTLAKVGYTDDTLYLAFAVEDDDITDMDNQYPRDDSATWRNDCIELFLSPERDARKEKQFIVGVSGSIWDGYRALTESKTGAEWNADWKSSVQKAPFGYTVEIAIPLAELTDIKKYPVRMGDVWYIKMTNVNKHPMNTTRSSFSPIGKSTGDMLNVGKLIFEKANILDNTDFTQNSPQGKPLYWDTSHYKPVKNTEIYSIVLEDEFPGTNILKVDYNFDDDICYRIYPGTAFKLPDQCANTKYRFSADIKWETKSEKNTLYFVKELNKSHRIVSDGKWHHYELDRFVWKDKEMQPIYLQGGRNSGTLYFKNISLKIIEDKENIPSDMMCLTNNATGNLVKQNLDTGGTFSYFDARTTSYWFPMYAPADNIPGESKHYAGEYPISESVLADGNTATGIRYAHHMIGHTGVDIIYDLKKEYEIAQIKVINNRPTVRDINVFLKSDGEEVYTLAASTYDRVKINMEGLKYNSKKGEVIKNIPITGSARYIRLQLMENIVSYSTTEIQIWGKPLSGGKIKKITYLQNNGAINKGIKEHVLDYSDAPPVLPEPQVLEYKNGEMFISDNTVICCKEGEPRTRKTAEVLKYELMTEFSLNLKISEIKKGEKLPNNCIFLTTNSAGKTVTGLKERNNSESWQIEQGYSLEVKTNTARIEGGGNKGLLYGCMTFIQLVKKNKENFLIPNLSILDWPAMEYRMALVSEGASKGLLRAFARYKYTHIFYKIYKISTAVENENIASDYLIGQSFLLDPRQIREFVKDKYRFVEWDKNEDRSHINFLRANVCPSDPEFWKQYEKMLDRWLPKLSCEFFSIGLDEMYQHHFGARWNVCPLCRARKLTAGQLLADFVCRIDKIAKKYGKSLLMCDTSFMRDFTLSREDDPDPHWNKALDLLPKDLMFFNWHYAPEKPMVAERLQSKGFKQVLYAIAAPQEWKALDKYFSGIMWSMGDDAYSPTKILAGAMGCWSPDKNLPESYLGKKLIGKNLITWAAIVKGAGFPSLIADKNGFFQINIKAQANRSLIDEKAYDGKGWLDMGPGFDLQALGSGKRMLGGIPFEIIDGKSNNDKACIMLHNKYYRDKTQPQSVEIPVGKKAKSLIFLHCLDNRPGHDYMRRQEVAGFYFIVFEDGTYDTYDIKYRVNAANWDGVASNTTYGTNVEVLRSARRVWEGDIEAGGKAHLYAAEWVNPKPDVKIEKILFRTRQTPTAMNPILFAVTAVKAGKNEITSEEVKLPSVTQLEIQKARGTLIDLRKGKDVSEELYIADNGIKISGKINNKLNDTTSDSRRDRSWIGMVNYDGVHGCARGYRETAEITFTFPEKRSLKGALFRSNPRDESKKTDFAPKLYAVTYECSEDGKNWKIIKENILHRPDEWGNLWLDTSNAGEFIAIRFRQEVMENIGRENGISMIRLYE